MVTLDYADIAGTVLKLAADFDQRMKPANQADHDARKASWATLFAGRVWPTESETAVVSHYRELRAFPLMPGDVIDYCDRQPVWSSLEHAQDWILRVGVRNPYSGAIEAYSGIQEPVITIPDELPRAQHKEHLITELTNWATPRLDELATAILTKQFKPWWANQ